MERVDEHGTSTEDLEKAAVFYKVNVNDLPVDDSRIGGLRNAVKEMLFPDDPFRRFKNQPTTRKWIIGLQYVFPILEWLPTYSFRLFKSDIVSGITIASLAIPQGISYAKLANLPPVMGLYSSFVPPLIYAILGSSTDLAVGTIAVVSILLASMLSHEVSPIHNPELYVRLAMTATFFAGVFQASLGIFRLGFIVDLLSHATIVGFMAGVATIVSLQQLKGILGLRHFTAKTDIVSIVRSVSEQVDKVSQDQ
uniref:SLC26A/SulP transporter domain-containing protein n=1 Tax=Picea sitchensis TaxID=3332 RepID=A9P1C0_PICSI|nr:unknown [Picea sitchensis]